MNISKKAKPGKRESKTEKKQFWSRKASEAHKDMKVARRTNNVGWQKMLKKRLAKYHSHYKENFMPSFANFFLEGKSLFNGFIEEALNSPYPYEYSEKQDGYVFFPNPDNEKVSYIVYLHLDPDYPERLVITFTYTDEDKNIQGTTDTTGSGDAFKVLATVKKIIIDFIDKIGLENLNIIQYTAKKIESSKVSLYKKLAQEFQSYLGSNWSFDTFSDSNQVMFEFSKKAF